MPLTTSGQFTILLVELNRELLVRHRKRCIDVRIGCHAELETIRELARKLESTEDHPIASECEALIETYETFLNANPFVLSNRPLPLPAEITEAVATRAARRANKRSLGA